MNPTDLFLSHSSGDAEVARELRVLLEEAGYSCWMAPDDVTGTDSWAEQILAAIDHSRAMLVLISSSANRSPHVSREVNLALGRRRAVLPIRIENVAPEASLEYLLSLMQRIDAFPMPIANHRDRILRRLAVIVPLQSTDPDDVSAPRTAAPSGLSDAPTQPMDLPAPVPPVATPVAIGPGSVVGAFTIEAVLGEGGMATVYRATQEEPRRAIALKVIRADHAADPTYRRRFLTEKDTLAALEHPSIVPIYAAGEADGRLFIAMRLVDGPDLAARLATAGRLSLAETIAILRPIGDAIDHAHEIGIVHRDLKPSNIILDRRGRPYLTDFGLGKNFDRPRELSAPGIALGTLEYMAPEQFSGALDPALADRVDIYALGCVAYACLTGASPFRTVEPERIIYGHLQGAIPDVRAVRPELPTGVDAALRRALAKNSADRYETADAFLGALASSSVATDAAPVAIATTAAPAPAAKPMSVETPQAPPPTFATDQRPVAPPVIPGPPLPPPPRRSAPVPGNIGAWVRANSVFAASIVTIATIIVIGGGIVLAGQAAGETARPSGTLSADATPIASSGPFGTIDAPLSSEPPQTLPPFSPPTPTASPDPTPPPTPKPDPTKRPDTQPPTGIGIAIKGGSIKTSKEVNLTLQATGATQMRLGRASSQSASCAWEGWRAYDTSINNFDLKGGGDAGPRWVCATFRDARENQSGVVRDGVTFDHAPVVDNSRTYIISGTKCSGTILELLPHLASDADGANTIDIIHVWRGTSTYGGAGMVDFTPYIKNGGTGVQIGAATGDLTSTWYFIVEDHLGVTRQGRFAVQQDC
jgi:serine/threonine protein kinase